MGYLSDRLGLHIPDGDTEDFGDYIPDNYILDLLKIDAEAQIRLLTAAGKIPVYDENGMLISSGIAPADLEAGLISSLLTTQGMLLYRDASALAALSPGTAGQSLLTQGAAANPIFGYPSHATLTNLTVGDPHTQYVLRSLLSTPGSIPYMGASAWQALVKGTTGYVLMAGSSYPYWGLPKLDDLAAPDDNTDRNVSTSAHGLCPKAPNSALQVLLGTGLWGTLKLDDLAAPDDNTDLNCSTSKHGLMEKLPGGASRFRGDGGWDTPTFGVDFSFGDGVSVIEESADSHRIPIAANIVAARIRSFDVNDRLSGSITCTLYMHYLGNVVGTAIDTFVLSSNYYYEETGLNIAVPAGRWLTIKVSGITSCKQIVCSLELDGI